MGAQPSVYLLIDQVLGAGKVPVRFGGKVFPQTQTVVRVPLGYEKLFNSSCKLASQSSHQRLGPSDKDKFGCFSQ